MFTNRYPHHTNYNSTRCCFWLRFIHPTDNCIFLVTKSSQTTRLQAPDRNMVLCEYISRFLMITTYCEKSILMVVAYPLKMVDTQCQ